VLADPNAKGEPGSGVTLTPSEVTASSSRTASENSHDSIAYKFAIAIKNTGDKTIAAVKWAYFFEPKDPAREGLAYLFTTRTNIPPGKEKTLNDTLRVIPGKGLTIKLPAKRNQALFNERAAILRLDYTDGTAWQSPAEMRSSPSTNSSH
jgi:hypothetical protein